MANVYYIRINKLVNGILTETYAPIPYPYSAEDLVALIPGLSLERANELIAIRYFEDTQGFCCQEDTPINPDIQYSNVTYTSFDVSWSGVNSEYTLQLLSSTDVVISTQTVTTTNFSFTGLSPNASYKVRVSINNCAGSISQTITVNTLVFIIQINDIGCGSSTPTGTITPSVYPYTLSMSLNGDVNTMCRINQFFVNGIDSYGSLVPLIQYGPNLFQATYDIICTDSTTIDVYYVSLTAQWLPDFVCEQF